MAAYGTCGRPVERSRTTSLWAMRLDDDLAGSDGKSCPSASRSPFGRHVATAGDGHARRRAQSRPVLIRTRWCVGRLVDQTEEPEHLLRTDAATNGIGACPAPQGDGAIATIAAPYERSTMPTPGARPGVDSKTVPDGSSGRGRLLDSGMDGSCIARRRRPDNPKSAPEIGGASRAPLAFDARRAHRRPLWPAFRHSEGLRVQRQTQPG